MKSRCIEIYLKIFIQLKFKQTLTKKSYFNDNGSAVLILYEKYPLRPSTLANVFFTFKEINPINCHFTRITYIMYLTFQIKRIFEYLEPLLY